MKIMSQTWRMDTFWGVVGDDKIKAFLSIILRIRDPQFYEFLFPYRNFFQSMFCVCLGIIFGYKNVFHTFCSTLTTFGLNIVFVSSKKTNRHIGVCDEAWFSLYRCVLLLTVILFANQNFLDDYLELVSRFVLTTLPLAHIFKVKNWDSIVRKVGLSLN